MKEYYKIKEISELYGIGTDSLRYYEKLGILSPRRGTNGYRLYGMREIYRLNVIKDLRQLGFSMQRIKDYLENKNVRATMELIDCGLRALTQKIAELQSIAQSLANRAEEMRTFETVSAGHIELRTCPVRHCVRLEVDATQDEEIDFALNILNKKFEHKLYLVNNYQIGASQRLELLKKEGYGHFQSVFYILPTEDYDCDFTLPAGRYLSQHYRGDYENATECLQSMLAYAEAHDLALAGELFELYKIDIHETNDCAEFLTEIQIRTI